MRSSVAGSAPSQRGPGFPTSDKASARTIAASSSDLRLRACSPVRSPVQGSSSGATYRRHVTVVAPRVGHVPALEAPDQPGRMLDIRQVLRAASRGVPAGRQPARPQLDVGVGPRACPR